MNTIYIPTEEELTAYVLGEVDENQKQAIETAVAIQPDTKELLNAIRETIERSESMFADINAETLSEEQRKTVVSASENVVRLPKRKTWERVVGYAAAAGIFGLISASIIMPTISTPHDEAMRVASEYRAQQLTSLESVADSSAVAIDESDDVLGERVYQNTLTEQPTGQSAAPVPVEKPATPKPKPKPKKSASAPAEYEIFDADSLNSPIDTTLTAEEFKIARTRGNVDQTQQIRRRVEEKGIRQADANGATIHLYNEPAPKRKLVPILGVQPTPGTAQFFAEGNVSTNRETIVLGTDGRYRVSGVPQSQQFRPAPPIAPPTPGTEAYERIIENRFKQVSKAPLSTFSIDVDTASYSNMRRFITQGSLPPVDSVRIEELINYFNYDYPQPVGEDPFSSSIEVGTAPWNPAHKLVRVGLKGKDIVAEERPNSNLVFLLDVSGSMNSQNKLPLVKQSIRLLTQQLTERDRVAIVVYAGNSGLVLPSTRGDQHAVILDALNRLSAGGSTNGGAGIELAYNVAAQNFIEGGVNRVLLASDGDFNVGTTSRGALVDLIERKAKSGVFLSVLGYGMGNLKDATMENLADKGNGNYAYIDTFHEAKKVLADEMNATLFTIAKDVKIQVEFNPNRVHAYRLIGYENRALANRDFNDDTKDAGEIGAGHTVTALYEIVPTGTAAAQLSGNVDALRYQTTQQPEPERAVESSISDQFTQEMMTVKLRYKQPDGNVSKLIEFHIADSDADFNGASADFKFATAVAAFGMKLRNSPFGYTMTYDTVLTLAESGRGHDLNGYRSEFIDLVRRTKSIAPPQQILRYAPRQQILRD